MAGTVIDEAFLPSIAPELLALILAIVLASRDDDQAAGPSEAVSRGEMAYRVGASPAAVGQGAFAVRAIQRGEVILTDAPLVIWPNELSAERANTLLDELTPAARRAYEALADARSPESTLDPILSRRGTNGFNVALPRVDAAAAGTSALAAQLGHEGPSTVSMVYPHVSRINHSCLPNADHAFDWSALRMTVYATRDIEADEEIHIEYTSALIQRSRAERRKILREDFGFDCTCRACSLEGAAATGSDERRARIDRLVGEVAEAGAAGPSRRAEVLAGLEELRTTLEQEGFVALPEFDQQGVSSAYAMYASARQNGSPPPPSYTDA